MYILSETHVNPRLRSVSTSIFLFRESTIAACINIFPIEKTVVSIEKSISDGSIVFCKIVFIFLKTKFMPQKYEKKANDTKNRLKSHLFAEKVLHKAALVHCWVLKHIKFMIPLKMKPNEQ